MNNNFYTHILSNNIQPILDLTTITPKIIISLFEVIVLIILCVWLLKKINIFKNRTMTSTISIIDKISIDSNKSIVVVDLKKVRLVLGVTSQSITHLYTLSSFSKNEEKDKKEKVVLKKKSILL